MRQRWQWEDEALNKLGYSGTNNSADRERAVDVVVELLKELSRINAMLKAREVGNE